MSEEITRLKGELNRRRQPQIPPPRVRVDMDKAHQYAIGDIKGSPADVLACALRIVGLFAPLDTNALTRIFEAINAVDDVQNGYGAKIEAVMADLNIPYDKSEDLTLIVGALLAEVLYYAGSAGPAFASAYLQLRGMRETARAPQPRSQRIIDQDQPAPGNHQGSRNYGDL
jgi:hypothetical protein